MQKSHFRFLRPKFVVGVYCALKTPKKQKSHFRFLRPQVHSRCIGCSKDPQKAKITFSIFATPSS
ncbi:hypothetical protein C0J52_04257 [Blattella germanica]|nr:hypothetical protein C0J52_04257 [Blattella germanica]